MMKNEIVKLRSSIFPALKRTKVLRGTFFALIGLSLLIYSGVFLSLATLKVWGIPIFFVGIGLITWGLLPYRQLNKLEIHPHELIIRDKVSLQINLEGKKTALIPWDSIKSAAYVNVSSSDYGIAIYLKRPLPQKMIVYDRKFDMQKFHHQSRTQHNCDLFLPYFSERSYQLLAEHFDFG